MVFLYKELQLGVGPNLLKLLNQSLLSTDMPPSPGASE